jgi:hypothetical protein
MNYQVINHDYMNTGGHCMISVFEVWLKDDNKTVFVNVGEEYVTITTVNHICRDLDIEDYSDITIAEFNYTDGDQLEESPYNQIMRECLFEYLKKDCGYCGYKQHLPYQWLLDEHQKLSKTFVKYLQPGEFSTYVTDGNSVWIETDSGSQILLSEEAAQPMSLEKTIAASLFRMHQMYDRDHEVMDSDDLGDLLTTIHSLEHWCAKLN